MSHTAGAALRPFVIGIAALSIAGAALLGLPLDAAAQEPLPLEQSLDASNFQIVGPLPTPDRIAGIVAQGTQDGSIPEDLDVTLITIDGDDVAIDDATVQTAADGSFEFTGFPKGEGFRYRLTTLYGNLRQTVNIEDALNADSITLRVFETTSKLESIAATTHVTIVPRVDGKTRLMGILELVEISNGGDKTFIADLQNPAPGGVPQLLRFSLPEGFDELTVDSDLPSGNVLEIETGFALSNAVPPGDFRVLFSYVIEYDGSEVVLDRSLPFDVHEYRVLMPPIFGKAEGARFTAIDDQQLGDTNYRVLQGSGFARGDRIRIVFTGLPEPGFTQRLQNFVGDNALVTVGLPLTAVAVMGAMLIYVFLVRDRRKVAATAGGMTRDELVAEIAALDQRRDEGGIEEEDYASRRRGLFDQALGAEGASEDAAAEGGDDEDLPATESDDGSSDSK